MSEILENSILLENSLCMHCWRVKRWVQQTPIYQAAGRSRKLLNLCLPPAIRDITDAASASIDNSSCYYQYYTDLGYGSKLIIAGWQEQAYDALLSVFISCPTKDFALLWEGNPTANNTAITPTKIIGKDGKEAEEIGLRFDVALRVAFHLPSNITVRQYIRAVDREKVPNIWDVEKNPRIWPLKWKMMHEEDRVVKTSDDPLMFRWRDYNFQNNRSTRR